MPFFQLAILVEDDSHIGEARRQTNRAAEQAGLDDLRRGQSAIIAMELATNLIRHARGGELFIQAVNEHNIQCLSFLAVDRGPGIEDVASRLRDGFSTAGTPGNGLGAVKRLSSEFEIYSTPTQGTIVFSRLNQNGLSRGDSLLLEWGVVSRPIASEIVNGDSWRIAKSANSIEILVVDGLGHGQEAAKAADEATAVFDASPECPLKLLFENAHARMRSTRGAAMAMARIHSESRTIEYVGVGNIAGCIRTGEYQTNRGLFSHNGTVGMQIRKIQVFNYEYPANGLIILHSDGLQTRWNLDAYPRLSQCHSAVIAGILYRDFSRGRDDATVAVVRLT